MGRGAAAVVGELATGGRLDGVLAGGGLGRLRRSPRLAGLGYEVLDFHATDGAAGRRARAHRPGPRVDRAVDPGRRKREQPWPSRSRAIRQVRS